MGRKLHIGGRGATPGWEVLDAIPAPHVDQVGNARDLSMYPDQTFEVLYASHVLEHFDYYQILPAVLQEWFRVLKPNGYLYVSVPDLEVLAKLLITKGMSVEDKFQIMRMMFGGHMDQFDYHMCGLNEDFMREYLSHAGYTGIQKVKNFGIFQDTSTMLFKGVAISLNIIARKPAI